MGASKLVGNMEYRYTFKTSYAPPPPVKGTPRVSNITDSGCLVQWSALRSMAAGDQLQYRVQLTRVKDQQVSTYDAGTDVQFRIAGLEAKAVVSNIQATSTKEIVKASGEPTWTD